MLWTNITIDCDFENYFPFENKIKFNQKKFLSSLFATIELIKNLNISATFFIHTSIYMRKKNNDLFYTKLDYLKLWKKLYKYGFDIGMHPHEEEPDGRSYYYYYPEYMFKILNSHNEILNKNNIITNSIRMGYFTFNEWLIPILEQLKINVSYDNMGGYISLTSNHFENAPLTQYFYSYKEKQKAGKSKILSIPLGMTEKNRLWNGLIPEANTFEHQKKLIDKLFDISQKKDLFINLMMHSYNVPKNYNKIKKTIDYLKNKSKIISSDETYKKNINY